MQQHTDQRRCLRMTEKINLDMDILGLILRKEMNGHHHQRPRHVQEFVRAIIQYDLADRAEK